MISFDFVHYQNHVENELMRPARIGIIGDYRPDFPPHPATNISICDASHTLGKCIEYDWLHTGQSHEYGNYDALWCSPGSPYHRFEEALEGIRYAREHGVPFLGTCAGFQHAVLEYARNVLGIKDATHAEYAGDSSVQFLTPLSCSIAGTTMQVNLTPGSRAAGCYDCDRVEEAYYCNYGINPDYTDRLESAGLRITGWDDSREPRVIELADHPFFVGTLFVPQMKSRRGQPHPLIMGFCRASLKLV